MSEYALTAYAGYKKREEYGGSRQDFKVKVHSD